MAGMSSAKISNFDTEALVLSNGIKGELFSVESRTPQHWADVIDGNVLRSSASVAIPAQLFLPRNAQKAPVVVFAVGSSGVNNSHTLYAQMLTDMGIGACLTDSFGPRGISVTYHDQRQLTYSASTYDLLVVIRALMAMDRINPERIGAIGPSRGGTAVLQASMRQLADPVLGAGRGLHAVLSMYPSGMFQFLNPDIGNTRIRVSMGDADRWTPLASAQAYANSIRLRGGRIDMNVYRDGEHSFDRADIPVMFVEDGVEFSRAPLCFISDNGYFCDFNGKEYRDINEREMRQDLHERFSHRGCSIGSKPGQPERFAEELKAFFQETLLG